MSKQQNGELLNKKDKKKDGVKETMIYGNGKTLEEMERQKKKYKNNKLNEGK